jgi:serine/threonine protein kinase
MHCPECDQDFNQRSYRFCPYDGTRLLAPSRQKEAQRDSAVPSGRVFRGRYKVRRFLAKGAMARIYIAEDEATGGLVAIKVLESKAAKNHELRERFLREANALALVNHQNVVSIHEVGEEADGTPFLIMEFLAGESLKEALERDRVIEQPAGLKILVQATQALFAAHAQGIVHRDIKPDNLFLIGDDPEHPADLRVLDFGLSRMFQSKLTAAGTVIGTPGYMAPEQVVADPVDQRTDVYGLGMVMYRMFVGRLPFDGPDDVTILAKQLLMHPPPPSYFEPGIDPRVERVIMTAIHKRPEHRFPSMQLFGNDLRAIARQSELWAPEPQRDYYDTSSLAASQIAAGYRTLLRQSEKHE